jgi:hypothetical protein
VDRFEDGLPVEEHELTGGTLRPVGRGSLLLGRFLGAAAVSDGRRLVA